MINILLDGSNIDADWLYGTLKKYIKPAQKVTVVAFSFAESIRSADMWEKLYTPRVGRYYDSIVGAFAAYGIGDDDVTFVNYFTDTPETAARKIMDADILYFPGGNPVEVHKGKPPSLSGLGSVFHLSAFRICLVLPAC